MRLHVQEKATEKEEEDKSRDIGVSAECCHATAGLGLGPQTQMD